MLMSERLHCMADFIDSLMNMSKTCIAHCSIFISCILQDAALLLNDLDYPLITLAVTFKIYNILVCRTCRSIAALIISKLCVMHACWCFFTCDIIVCMRPDHIVCSNHSSKLTFLKKSSSQLKVVCLHN